MEAWKILLHTILKLVIENLTELFKKETEFCDKTRFLFRLLDSDGVSITTRIGAAHQ